MTAQEIHRPAQSLSAADLVDLGWLLKETYPKRPREVVDFLKPWRGRTARLLLRYAAEKMTERDREVVLLKPNLEQKRR